MGFALFPFHLSKVLRLPRKSDAKLYEVLHLSRKIILANLKIRLQNAAFLRKSAPGPPNISDSCVSCTAPAARHASLQILFKCPTRANVFGTVSRLAHFWEGAESLVPASERPKVVRTWCLCTFWLSTCASRQNGVHFFDSSTSKSTPALVCFVRFYFECASRHNRVHFFDILTSKSVPTLRRFVLLCTFWFRFVLTLRRNGVQFFTSRLPRWLCTRRFSGRIFFDPPEPQNIGKTQCLATFLPFCAPASSFFWPFFSSYLLSSLLFSSLLFASLRFASLRFASLLFSSLLWLFPPLLFHLSILSEVWLLNFLW